MQTVSTRLMMGSARGMLKAGPVNAAILRSCARLQGHMPFSSKAGMSTEAARVTTRLTALNMSCGDAQHPLLCAVCVDRL